jgi:hypothetical protein
VDRLWGRTGAWVLATALGLGAFGAVAQATVGAQVTPVAVGGFLAAVLLLGAAQWLALRPTGRVTLHGWTAALLGGTVLAWPVSIVALSVAGPRGAAPWAREPSVWDDPRALLALLAGSVFLAIALVQAIYLRWDRGPAGLWLLVSVVGGAAFGVAAATAHATTSSLLTPALAMPIAYAVGGVFYGLATIPGVLRLADRQARRG